MDDFGITTSIARKPAQKQALTPKASPGRPAKFCQEGKAKTE
jgi:hypothetical protein